MKPLSQAHSFVSILLVLLLQFSACQWSTEEKPEKNTLPKFVFDTIDTQKYSAEANSMATRNEDWICNFALGGSSSLATMLLNISAKNDSLYGTLHLSTGSGKCSKFTFSTHTDCTQVAILFPMYNNTTFQLYFKPEITIAFPSTAKTETHAFMQLKRLMYKSYENVPKQNEILLLAKSGLWNTDTFHIKTGQTELINKVKKLSTNDSISLILKTEHNMATVQDILAGQLPYCK